MVNCLCRLERRNHCEGQVCTYVHIGSNLSGSFALARSTMNSNSAKAEDGLFQLHKAEDSVLSPFWQEFAANCAKSG